MLSRTITSRTIFSHRSSQFQSRCLSGQAASAAEKLKGVLEEYRLTHYTQTVPSRFKKGIVAAAKSRQKDENGLIGAAGMHRVMTNIKMADRITQQEMSIIFQGIGCESGLIHADEMMKFI